MGNPFKKAVAGQREFIVTDQCFFVEAPKKYNPDKRRTPHYITVIDSKTGTVRKVKSGSRIAIIEDAAE